MEDSRHPPSPSPSPQSMLHQSDADDDDDSVRQLKYCSSLYLSLQDCLVETNRNWKSCQKEVQALKACNEKRTMQRDNEKSVLKKAGDNSK